MGAGLGEGALVWRRNWSSVATYLVLGAACLAAGVGLRGSTVQRATVLGAGVAFVAVAGFVVAATSLRLAGGVVVHRAATRWALELRHVEAVDWPGNHRDFPLLLVDRGTARSIPLASYREKALLAEVLLAELPPDSVSRKARAVLEGIRDGLSTDAILMRVRGLG